MRTIGSTAPSLARPFDERSGRSPGTCKRQSGVRRLAVKEVLHGGPFTTMIIVRSTERDWVNQGRLWVRAEKVDEPAPSLTLSAERALPMKVITIRNPPPTMKRPAPTPTSPRIIRRRQTERALDILGSFERPHQNGRFR